MGGEGEFYPRAADDVTSSRYLIISQLPDPKDEKMGEERGWLNLFVLLIRPLFGNTRGTMQIL